jgi:hypothetical protein
LLHLLETFHVRIVFHTHQLRRVEIVSLEFLQQLKYRKQLLQCQFAQEDGLTLSEIEHRDVLMDFAKSVQNDFLTLQTQEVKKPTHPSDILLVEDLAQDVLTNP